MNYTGFGTNPLLGDNRPAAMYTFGGGTVGGQIWNPDLTISESAQKAARASGKKGIKVLPAGAGSKQEMRYLREEAEREGYLWTEAPEKFVRGQTGKGYNQDPKKLYNVRTGAPYSGTLMWRGGGYGGYPKRDKQPTSPQPPAPQETNIASGQAPTLSPRESSYSGSALEGTAYTPSAPNMGMGTYAPPITEQTPAFGLGGSSLTSPLAGPSPSLQFPTDMDRILNPYGLKNYY